VVNVSASHLGISTALCEKAGAQAGRKTQAFREAQAAREKTPPILIRSAGIRRRLTPGAIRVYLSVVAAPVFPVAHPKTTA
jgi:hypothetical protein